MILIEILNRKGNILAYNHDNVLVAKQCGTCKELTSVCDFHKAKRDPTGLVSQCKVCVAKSHQKYYTYEKTFVINRNENGELISRQCSECKLLKDRSCFYKNSTSSTGYSCVCISCQGNKSKQYYAENSEVIKEKNASYYLENSEKVKAKVNEYRVENRDVVLEKKREYGKKVRQEPWWIELHRDSRVVCTKKWRNENREHIKEYNKQYKSENSDMCNVMSMERSNRKRIQESFSVNFREESKKFFGQVRILNKLYGERTFSVDHIIPLIHTNVCGLHYPENFKIIPTSENSSKGNKWDGTHDNTNWETDWRIGQSLSENNNE